MHILLIPSWYSTPDNPIRGSFFREQALALQKVGHRVGLLIPPGRVRTFHGLKEIQRQEGFSQSDEGGLPTLRVGWWGWLPSIIPPLRKTPILNAFDTYVHQNGKPDVLHAHSTLYGGWAAAHIRAARGVPAVLTEHSSTLVRGLTFPDQIGRIRFALKNMDRVLAVSPVLADRLQKIAPGVSVDLIGNIVDAELFTFAPPPPMPPFAFALIANLNPNKGVDVMLRAFAGAFRSQQVIVRIVGDGAERQKLEGLAGELGIREQVEFLGRIPREAVRDLLHRTHALISSSYIETFGLTIIEAFASGRPVVATRSGGADALIDENNGLLVPAGDVDTLSAALRTMTETYARYDAEAIRADCLSRYSEAVIVRQLEAIYESVGVTDPATK
ncbi:MAG: glycosyltransferase [Anaerolineae bacterium]|nr:glycosyltransferase [Anaerolineae bacterium]